MEALPSGNGEASESESACAEPHKDSLVSGKPVIPHEAMALGSESDAKKEWHCAICNVWLNGQTQWQDHLIGKKHKKTLRTETPVDTHAAASGV